MYVSAIYILYILYIKYYHCIYFGISLLYLICLNSSFHMILQHAYSIFWCSKVTVLPPTDIFSNRTRMCIILEHYTQTVEYLLGLNALTNRRRVKSFKLFFQP